MNLFKIESTLSAVLRLSRKFVTIPNNIAAPQTPITNICESSRLKAIEISKEVFPRLSQYNPKTQVRIMFIFSKHNLRDERYFDRMEEHIARNISSLAINDVILLLQSLYNYKIKFDQSRVIFASANGYLLRMTELQMDGLLPLVNVLVKLKWHSKIISHIIRIATVKDESLNSMKFPQLIRLCTIAAEQSHLSLSQLHRLLTKAFEQLQKVQMSKLSSLDIALTYRLFFSDLLRIRINQIYQFLKAKNLLNQVIGTSAESQSIETQKLVLQQFLTNNSLARQDYQRKVVKMNPSFTIEEIVLMSSTQDKGLRILCESLYRQKIFDATPLEFVRLLKTYGNSSDLSEYFNRHIDNMSLNEILYIVQHSVNLFPQYDLQSIIVKAMARDDQPINSKQFEWIVRLATIVGVDKANIDAFISKFDNQ